MFWVHQWKQITLFTPFILIIIKIIIFFIKTQSTDKTTYMAEWLRIVIIKLMLIIGATLLILHWFWTTWLSSQPDYPMLSHIPWMHMSSKRWTCIHKRFQPSIFVVWVTTEQQWIHCGSFGPRLVVSLPQGMTAILFTDTSWESPKEACGFLIYIFCGLSNSTTHAFEYQLDCQRKGFEMDLM